MSEFAHAIAFVIAHVGTAAYAALVFTLGLVGAFIAVRYRIEALIAFPRWMANKLQGLIFLPPVLLFLLIFGFNGTAICAYMLTGAIHYLVPVFIAFMTGTNIGIIMLLGVTSPPDAPRQPVSFETNPRRQAVAMLCGLLTALLELPCFWLGIALGMTLGGFGGGTEGTRAAIAQRVRAYAQIILPILCISAAAETLGIKLMIRTDRKEDDT